MTRPDLVSETIGNETIVLDMRSGTFYATRGAGSTLWDALRAGHAPEQLLEVLRASWGTGPEFESAHAFLADLDGRGLLTNGGVSITEPLVPFTTGPAAHVTLEVYEDLSDLMLLDPVHDVTPQGWPSPARE